MGSFQKALLFIVLFVIVALIILTWGSVGSGILTLALLIGIGFLLLKRFLETQVPVVFNWEGFHG